MQPPNGKLNEGGTKTFMCKFISKTTWNFQQYTTKWASRVYESELLIEDRVIDMQLDVGVSPPANLMAFRPGSTHLTFDLDPCDLWPWLMTLDLFLVIFFLVTFFLVTFVLVNLHRRTDGQTESDA